MTARHEISATMAAALAFADEHGGELVRYSRGFWTFSGCPRDGNAPVEYFGTTTIEGLVRRGRMRYSQWQRHHREFPIAAEVVE